MKRSATLALLLLSIGCVTAREVGERRYREGDRRGALEAWRQVAPSDASYPQVSKRIAIVEAEFEELIVAYKENAERLEAEGRLAESVLDYRLALALQPGDAATLAHVQRLARELEARKIDLGEEYARVRSDGNLIAARDALEQLRTLDPFEPAYAIEERELQAALNAQWRRREARIRASLANEMESLVEAGRAAFRDERLETALDLWRRALLLDPSNERIQAYIARAERQLENLERLRSTAETGEAH